VTGAKAARPEATARAWSAGSASGPERATAAEKAVGEMGRPAGRRPRRAARGVAALARDGWAVSANGWWAAAELAVARAGQGRGSRRSGI